MIDHDGWRVMGVRYTPDASIEGHLVFALKNEGLDLYVLKRIFEATGSDPIKEIVAATPTGSYARRIWFLYEWLTSDKIDLPEPPVSNYVQAVDPDLQFCIKGEKLPRYRVVNNLPGTKDFCPMVFYTDTLDGFIGMDLAARAKDTIAKVPKDVMARTAAFLLLKDSKSSYAIEGERPPQDRIQRWGKAIGEAGRQALSHDEFLRLQRIVIGDDRFVKLGYRDEGGFVGERDFSTQSPLPDHISAKHEDLEPLMEGLITFGGEHSKELDAVVAAAMLAFGFVYIHPFEDGNGRLHRFLIHHALALRGFNPPGIVFPVSAAILEHIETYRSVLESHSSKALPFVEWRETPEHNVEVTNETADLYRYFDATPHAEFLYECVAQTIEIDLPKEAQFLQNYDRFDEAVQNIVDMPERLINLLFKFLEQNDGKFSERARSKEFAALSEAETKAIEKMYSDIFGE
ncbi:Fic family protein [Parasphingorhabdus cellanae]|uniref:Fic family protein n=1 Tax=Parasphingorhabdus cellanae TaxID=2806553 RepID=A0ABX7TAN9_9SPHN|nr:Fic family protein [Parasphingorhabdus cellanae]QTD57298.1 Fic family protein [Parasphingorhabdus cellanae]